MISYFVKKYPSVDLESKVVEELQAEGLEECTIKTIVGFWRKDVTK